jgi:23S rRNA (cytosine1962-C5)-methyltransferase
VIFDHADPPSPVDVIHSILDFYHARLPWISAGMLKPRNAPDAEMQRGVSIYGEKLDRRVREDGVWYALDLSMSRDASLYLDTRGLRAWAKAHLKGKTVLNAFAYSGSLGVAALAGEASQVIQLDQSRRYLNLAKDSYMLNGFAAQRGDFIAADFFAGVGLLKRAGRCFDCVLLDPPYFSSGPRGGINLEHSSSRLINKVRPLVADGGFLAAVNNSLYLSGADCLGELEALCADGYLTIEELVPVPPDVTGFPETRVSAPPADPAPFNHATKIAVLRVRRKQ